MREFTAVVVAMRAIRLVGQPGRWVLPLAVGIVSGLADAAGGILLVVLIALISEGADAGGPIAGLVFQLPGAAADPAVTLAVLLSIFFALRGLLLVAQAYLQQRAAALAGVDLSGRLLRGYLDMPYQRALSRNTSELIRNTQESVDGVTRYVLAPSLSIATDGVLILALGVLLTLTAPGPTLGALGLLLLLSLATARLVQPRFAVEGVRSQEEARACLQDLQQSLQGTREVRLSGRPDHFVGAYAVHRRRHARASYRYATLAGVPRAVMETAFVLLLVFYLLYLSVQDGGLGEALPVLGLFAYAVLRILPAANRMLAAVGSIRFGAEAVNKVEGDLGSEVADGRPTAPTADAAMTPAMAWQRLELRGVGFEYEPGRPVLEDVAIEVSNGETIALVGPTGGGKSTLLDIMLGLLVLTSGRVTVDQKPLHAPDVLSHWRGSIGMVPQTVFLTDDQLRRNVAFGVPDREIDDERVWEVLGEAQLRSFVESLPDGLETTMGEWGGRLSGGQRQRVAIARALYRDPSLLAFDEGTSSLDAATEAQIMSVLDAQRGRRALVIVAHRLETVRRADRIYLLQDGQVVDSGTYEALERRNRFFHRERPT